MKWITSATVRITSAPTRARIRAAAVVQVLRRLLVLVLLHLPLRLAKAVLPAVPLVAAALRVRPVLATTLAPSAVLAAMQAAALVMASHAARATRATAALPVTSSHARSRW